MSTPIGDGDAMHEFETEVAEELSLAESSHPEETTELPASEWLYDPTDVERDEIGLCGLVGTALVRCVH